MLTEAKCVASHNLALSLWTEIPGAEVQPLTLTASNNHLVVLQWEALPKFRLNSDDVHSKPQSASQLVNQPSSCTRSLSPSLPFSLSLTLALCVCMLAHVH